MTQHTQLYEKHLALTGGRNMAEFAGYLMPLWYSSIKAEHEAVRNTAGLFDCTHMGVLDFCGPTASEYLNLVTANDINKLRDGQAQYSFFFDANGTVIDDLIVYRVSNMRYIMVVNAANDEKVQSHLAELGPKLAGKINKLPVIRDLRAQSSGPDRRVVMPLQGPESKKLIASLISDPNIREKYCSLGSFEFCEVTVVGIETLVCKTGYTGSEEGSEFLVHPDKVETLWDAILDAGQEKGVLPCGLGARDSLRIQAGLPLYGHELEGEHHISPFQAGYGWAVSLEKGWFWGYQPVKDKATDFDMKIFRLVLNGSKGVRPVREHDGILNKEGICVGQVLSSTKSGDSQIVLAFCKVGSLKLDDKVGGFYIARNQRHIQQGKPQQCQLGQSYPTELDGVVAKRFVKY